MVKFISFPRFRNKLWMRWAWYQTRYLKSLRIIVFCGSLWIETFFPISKNFCFSLTLKFKASIATMNLISFKRCDKAQWNYSWKDLSVANIENYQFQSLEKKSIFFVFFGHLSSFRPFAFLIFLYIWINKEKCRVIPRYKIWNSSCEEKVIFCQWPQIRKRSFARICSFRS